MTPEDGVRIRRTARQAGWLYLALVPLGLYSLIYVPSTVLVEGDAAATARSILASEWLFRSGIVVHLATEIVFVCLAFVLYRVLVPVSKSQAALMVALVLLSVPIGFVNELNHIAALRLLDGADYLEVFTAGELHAQVMFFLDLWDGGVVLAQVFWGLWLFPLGHLVYRSGFLPGWLGILLVVAGAGYLFDVLVVLLFPGAGVSVAMFTFVGEVLFALWLVIKGVDEEAWRRAATA